MDKETKERILARLNSQKEPVKKEKCSTFVGDYDEEIAPGIILIRAKRVLFCSVCKSPIEPGEDAITQTKGLKVAHKYHLPDILAHRRKIARRKRKPPSVQLPPTHATMVKEERIRISKSMSSSWAG